MFHDGTHYPFVSFKHIFRSGDQVFFKAFQWSRRFDDKAEAVGVQPRDQ